MVLRLTLVNIYIYICVCVCVCVCVHFVCCMYQLFNCLFICSMLKNHFVLNGIVEIASVYPMHMEEDPSTVVLDDNECCATLYLELVSS